MAQERPYKRRKVFIKPSYQFKFILKFCLILLAGGIISTVSVLLLSRGTLTTAFEHGRLIVKPTASAIFPIVLLTNAVTLAIVTLIAIVTVLYVSHKIAGPMFRFEKDMGLVKNGDLTIQITLRKKDQFVALSQSLTEMVSNLREKVLSLESEILKAEKEMAQKETGKEFLPELERIRISIHKNFKV